MSESDENDQQFDPDEFTKQQTENLINEDSSDYMLGKSESKNDQLHCISNGEYIIQKMNDQTLCKRIEERYSHLKPILQLKVVSEDNSLIELEESDIIGVFERFGEVNVEMNNQSFALIYFKRISRAYFALQVLNGIEIQESKVTIYLEWFDESRDAKITRNCENASTQFQNEKDEVHYIPLQALTLNLGNQQMNPQFDRLNRLNPVKPQFQGCESVSNSQNSSAHQGMISNTFSNNNQQNNNLPQSVKYTCRYEIQIQNDKEFQVARKIIGARGENMKKILKKCTDLGKKQSNQYILNEEEHGVKLRLRGKGSGYKEGQEKQESQDALHLCVSSTCKEAYEMACDQVEELLEGIYEEYYIVNLQKNNICYKFSIKKQDSSCTKQVATTQQYQGGNNINQTFNLSVSQKNQQQMHSINQDIDQVISFNNPPLIWNDHIQKRDLIDQYDGNSQQILESGISSQSSQQQNYSSQLNKNKISERQILLFIEQRNKARKESNFQEADRIRNYLKNNGICLMDEKGGRGKGQDVTTWKYIKSQQGTSPEPRFQQNQPSQYQYPKQNPPQGNINGIYTH